MSSSLSRLICPITVSASLAACVVLPIDPITGRPWGSPYESSAAPSSESAARTTVIMPAAPASPPQASVVNARLYPLNAAANKGGLLSAVVVDQHTGRGRFTLTYQGDNLQGEATRVDQNYSGFGRIHQEVLDQALHPAPGAQRGIANAYGAKGVNAQCEYMLTGSSQGTGVCMFSDGAKYQMHFGG